MDRSGWVAWASTATLIGVIVAANGFVVLGQTVEVMEEQSRDDPAEGPWYTPLAGPLALAAAGLQAVSAAAIAYGWAKASAKKRQPRLVPQGTPEATDEDDRIVAPPGFGGSVVRTKRAGSVPLVAWSVGGVLVLVGGVALALLAVMTFEQTATMDGRGFRQAVLWGRLLRFAATPLMAIGSASLGLAWGRWFPLGALEVIETKTGTENQRPLTLKWQRQE